MPETLSPRVDPLTRGAAAGHSLQRRARGHPGAEDATPEEQPAEGYATGKADEVVGLTVYRGELYCISNHRRGVFKYAGGESWELVGLAAERIMTLTIYRDGLYALINGGPVARYEGGNEWSDAGHPDRSEQTYAGVTFGGELYVGTWPEGEVLRFDGERSSSSRREPASLGLSEKTAADSAFGEDRSYGGDEDDEFDVPVFLR